MKLLFLDIECSPNVADVWQLFNVGNISLSQLRESSRMMCFAAKWHNDDRIFFRSEHSIDDMVEFAWNLIDQADVIGHYNGRRFDMPILNKEFLLREFEPPAPYQQIDFLEVMRKTFRFPSNKLEYVADVLELSGKLKHSGHELWTQCLAGDETAWRKMEEYNTRDVLLLEELYDRLLPWISNHPTTGLYGDEPEIPSCPRCDGVTTLVKEGFAYTKTCKYQRYRCTFCGGWSQEGKRLNYAELRSI